MKIIYLCVLLLTANVLYSQEVVWKWQNPLPSGNGLSGVSFPTFETGYMTGDAGTVIKCENLKLKLMPKIANGDIYLRGCQFFDENKGFAVGGTYYCGYVCKTNDGAKTWELYKIDELIANSLQNINFINEKLGFISGYTGCLYKTTDGGLSWIKQNDIPIWSERFVVVDDSTYVVCSRQGKICKTIDSAKTWNITYNDENEDIMSLFFLNKTIGWAGGRHGLILHTTDGGSTWTKQNINNDWYQYYFNSLWFIDENNGIASSTYGISAFTNNGGKTWVNGNTNFSSSVNASCSNQNRLWTVGEFGTINYYDSYGPGIVNLNSLGFVSYLNNINFYDENLGFAIGDYGTILKTNDGGNSWSKKETQYAGSFNTSFIKSKDTIFISTEGANVLRSTDSGDTWETMKVDRGGRYSSLYAMCFSSQTTAWAVGYNGLILKSTDEGANWNFLPFLNGYEWRAISFLDSLNGFVGNIIGELYVTSDGGVNWILKNQYNEEIRKIQFYNNLEGWLLTKTKLYYTNDAGNSWNLKRETDSTNYDFTSFSFLNSSTGWLIGNYMPTIFFTTDTGDSWKKYVIPEEIYIKDVCFKSKSTGWLAGSGGFILRTDNGGISEVVENPFIIENNDFLISPNPASNSILIQSNNIEVNSYSIELFDINGNKAIELEKGLNFNTNFSKTYYLNSLASGVYYIKIQYYNKICTKAIIIQR